MPLVPDSGDPLLTVYAAALRAVEGAAAVRRQLSAEPFAGPCRLAAVGKAAQSMAEGACAVLGGAVRGGLVISKTGHLDPARLQALGLEGMEAAHPVPDAGSLAAGQRLLAWLAEDPTSPLLFLVSGGASSLVEVPAAGLGLEDLARAGRWLLGSGLDIGDMNRVRKSLSLIKGGGLLGHLGDGQVRVLAISDVPGDDPGVIGSGLLVPDPGLERAVAALALPDWLSGWVARGLAQRAGIPSRGPKVEIVANLDLAREAAVRRARELGLAAVLHPQFVDGDAAAVGERLARLVLDSPPGLHVWGGETTVVLPRRPGRGGRNQHLALAAARVLAGHADCRLLAAGTDGSDGPTADAGARVDGATLERAAVEGFDAERTLQAADAGSLLEASGDLVHTGPTGTNVMDLVLGLKTDG